MSDTLRKMRRTVRRICPRAPLPVQGLAAAAVRYAAQALRSTPVTSDRYGLEERDPGDDPFVVGWWVGPDGNWHPPDEPFRARPVEGPHPLRRVVVVLLAVAIGAATTVGVLAGGGTQSRPTGPSVAQLTHQVRLAVTGSGGGQVGVRGVTGVECRPPSTWSSGQTFTCDVFGPAHAELGRYVGTVQPTTPSGAWRWRAEWRPSRPYAVTGRRTL